MTTKLRNITICPVSDGSSPLLSAPAGQVIANEMKFHDAISPLAAHRPTDLHRRMRLACRPGGDRCRRAPLRRRIPRDRPPEGSVDGVAPNFPVHVLRDGTYLTDTYSPGKLALWGPDGQLLKVLGVNRDWFRAHEGWAALVHALQADGRGLIWAAGSVPDPDAPPVRRPAGEEAPLPMGSLAETLRYIDFFIEALTPEGRLVASVRLDSSQGPVHPIPGPGGLWYRPLEDELSIVILEASLLERQR